jgi:hypothetical protein
MNFGASPGNEFFAFIFDDSIDPNNPDPNDMRGGKRAARRFVDWQTFFKLDSVNFRPNKRIDSKISTPLFLLPGQKGPAHGLPTDGPQSLASRNLMRHVNFGIPSGQAIARVMGARVLTPEQLQELAEFKMESNTPLWLYILKEAEVLEQGMRLGPVGGGIVGEVFIGLLKADKDSYLSANRNWKPTLPSAKSGDFEITDLLKFAGVVPPLEQSIPQHAGCPPSQRAPICTNFRFRLPGHISHLWHRDSPHCYVTDNWQLHPFGLTQSRNSLLTSA